MTKLTSKARDAIPDSKFAGPGRSYPIEDKAHARNAKARASEMEHKGKLSPEEKAKIDAKADKVLGESKPLADVLGELFQANPDPKMRSEIPDEQKKFFQVNNVAPDGKTSERKRFTDIDPSTLDDKLFNASNIKQVKYNRAPQKDTVVGESKETGKKVPYVPLARKPMCEVLGLQEARVVSTGEKGYAIVKGDHAYGYKDNRWYHKKDLIHSSDWNGINHPDEAELKKHLSKANATPFNESVITEAKDKKKPSKKTPEEEDGDIEAKHEKTLQEHTKAMKRARAEDQTFGLKQDFGPDKSMITSQTSKGMLTTCHEHGNGRITHEWGEAK